ncbi:AraC family transcriptional regulator [Maricurvus nonylphenolicus]
MRYTSKNSISISITYVNVVLSKARLDQSVIDELLHNSRIPNHLLQEPNARVSLVQYAQLMDGLTQATGDEFLGHGSSPVPLGSMSLLTHWLVATKTLAEAAERIARFYQMIGQGQAIHSYTEGDLLFFEIELPSYKRHSDFFIAELFFSNIHRLLSWLTMEIIHIDRVELQCEMHDHAQDYPLLFYAAPIHFNQRKTRISFSPTQLAKPVQQNLSNLEKFLESPNFEILVLDFKADNLASRVAVELRKNLDAMPALPELAETMDIKPYTLQRRLADEGMTYLGIKNQVKRDAAIDFLVNTDLSIEEISAQLGFSETSPFTRTFKEWTGIPPSAYRKYH